MAAVVPMMGKELRTEYRVLVFRQGHEVYQETEETLEEAIRSAGAYLDWHKEQDFDS